MAFEGWDLGLDEVIGVDWCPMIGLVPLKGNERICVHSAM